MKLAEYKGELKGRGRMPSAETETLKAAIQQSLDGQKNILISDIPADQVAKYRQRLRVLARDHYDVELSVVVVADTEVAIRARYRVGDPRIAQMEAETKPKRPTKRTARKANPAPVRDAA